jgi:hypothetical protein
VGSGRAQEAGQENKYFSIINGLINVFEFILG